MTESLVDFRGGTGFPFAVRTRRIQSVSGEKSADQRPALSWGKVLWRPATVSDVRAKARIKIRLPCEGRRLVPERRPSSIPEPLDACQSADRAMHASIRIAGSNPDHHLWNNNGTWWCHFTVHGPDFTKQRIRRSTGTKDRQKARQIRDSLLSTLSTPNHARP